MNEEERIWFRVQTLKNTYNKEIKEGSAMEIAIAHKLFNRSVDFLKEYWKANNIKKDIVVSYSPTNKRLTIYTNNIV